MFGFALAFVCMVAVGEPQGKTIEFDFEASRQAKVILTPTKKEYRLKVFMRPVQAFDKATNVLLSFEKARELAYIALAKHLSTEERVTMTVSGAETLARGIVKKQYILSMRIPKKGVMLTKHTGKDAKLPKKASTQRLVLNSSLFTRKHEYRRFLHVLKKRFVSDLKCCGKENKPAKFDKRIQNIRNQLLLNVGKIKSSIEADLLLFSSEQKELLRHVAAQREEFLEMLGKAKKDNEKQHKKKEKSGQS